MKPSKISQSKNNPASRPSIWRVIKTAFWYLGGKVQKITGRILKPIEKRETLVSILTGIFLLISSAVGLIQSLTGNNVIYLIQGSYIIGLLLEISNIFSTLFALLLLANILLMLIFDPFRGTTSTVARKWEEIKDRVSRKEQSDLLKTAKVNSTELKTLTRLGYEAFGDDWITLENRLLRYRSWLTKNEKVFSFVLNEQHEPIGYVCVLPLNDDLHLKGTYSQFHFEEKHISNTKARYIYLQAIYLKVEYRDKLDYLVPLFMAMFDKITTFASSQPIVYAEAFTWQGAKLLGRLGFKESDYSSPEGHPIHILDCGMHSWLLSLRGADTVRFIKELKKQSH